MILSDRDIKKALKDGEIKISPTPDLKVALGTVSVDLKLGHDFLVYRTTSRPYIDVQDKESFNMLTEKVSKKTGNHLSSTPETSYLEPLLKASNYHQHSLGG
jgi:dCTP deaminase